VETASIGAHDVQRTVVREGELVFIIVDGPNGIPAMQAAKARVALVVMADIDGARLQAALSLGADQVVNAAKEDALARVMNLSNGEGAPVVLEAVGQPKTIEATVDYAASTGRIAIMGDGRGNVTFPPAVFLRKELDFIGSRNSWGRFSGIDPAHGNRRTAHGPPCHAQVPLCQCDRGLPLHGHAHLRDHQDGHPVLGAETEQ